MTKSLEQIIAETKKREAKEKAERDRKVAEASATYQKWRDEQERKKQAALEKERAERQAKAEATFERRMRDLFFGANPHASEADYKSARPKLRERLLIDDAVRQEQENKARLRREVKRAWDIP